MNEPERAKIIWDEFNKKNKAIKDNSGLKLIYKRIIE
jgi:hypothetical protein